MLNKRVRLTALLPLCVTVLSACHASNGTAIPAVASLAAGATTNGSHSGVESLSKLAFALPVIVPGNAAPTPKLRADALSSATRSISGTFGSKTFAVQGLTSTTPGCTSESNGLHCIVTLDLPIGTNELKLYTYSSADGSGVPLATATNRATVVRGQTTYIQPPKWNALASSLKLDILPNSLEQGQASTADILFLAVDESGTIIPSQTVVDSTGKRIVAAISATGPYNSIITSKTAPFTSHVFSYDGRLVGKETIEASANGAKLAAATLVLKAGSTESAQLFVYSGGQGQSEGPYGTLFQFAANASGNVAPLRSYRLGAPPIAIESNGTFWAGPIGLENLGQGRHGASWLGEYSDTGQYLTRVRSLSKGVEIMGAAFDSRQNLYAVQGLVTRVQSASGCEVSNPTLSIYSAASRWTRVTREIDLTLPFALSCFVPITVDAHGNAFVIPDNGTNGTIDEYGPGVGGHAPPVRSFVSNESDVTALAVDTLGNLFVLGQFCPYGNCESSFVEFAPSSSTPQQVLPGQNVTAFALDAQNDVYAGIYTPPTSPESDGTYSIEEFSANSTTPMRVIGGNNTQIAPPSTYPAVIMVAP